jgi:hypothetical protein
MDIFSHALWGLTVVRKKELIWWTVLFGILPDIASTGIGFCYYLLKKGFSFPDHWWIFLPDWSKKLYFFFHSFFGLISIFFLLLIFKRRHLILTLPYLLHILFDLFSHKSDPLARLFYPLVNYRPEREIGFNWWENWLLWYLNFFLLILVNVILFGRKRLKTIDN